MIGGGGNRTPVPRRLSVCFYVCSRSFESRVGGRQPTGSRFPQPDCWFASVWPGVTPRLAHCSASFGIVDVSRSTGYPFLGSHGK